MHYLKLLLVKAKSEAQARSEVNKFMDEVISGIGDFYEITKDWEVSTGLCFEAKKLTEIDPKDLQKFIDASKQGIKRIRDSARAYLNSCEEDPDDWIEQAKANPSCQGRYHVSVLGTCIYPDQFNNHITVYDITKKIANKLPENAEGYWLVCVEVTD